MNKHVGILTAGGDSPGLNAAIRGIGKTAILGNQMDIVGFRDGFRGLMENRTMRLDMRVLSSILTLGGTILGTSRDKPHKMPVGDDTVDMTDVICDNYYRNNLDMLICLGGGGYPKKCLPIGAERAEYLDVAENHRQRCRNVGCNIWFSYRHGDCHRGHRQVAFHSS